MIKEVRSEEVCRGVERSGLVVPRKTERLEQEEKAGDEVRLRLAVVTRVIAGVGGVWGMGIGGDQKIV